MKELQQRFFDLYGGEEGTLYFTPGRVNLIGEHIDYSGGMVFPCALSIGTYGVVRLREDKTVRIYSDNFPQDGILTFSLEEPIKAAGDWGDYPRGIFWTLQEKGYALSRGMDLYYYGTIPNGAGLSSSASIEVLTMCIVSDLLDLGISRSETALLCQFSENQFNKVNCGIMDQFACAMGKENCGILLNTNTMDYRYVPLELGGCCLMITCSNKQRKLGESKYNERRAECEEGLAVLKEFYPIRQLCDLKPDQLGDALSRLEKDNVRRRVRHAVTEQYRTMEAARLLEAGDLEGFGACMNASHESLRDDYCVTGMEMDTLAEEAWKVPGVLGSRITGAGFGGCTVTLLRKEAVDAFQEQVGKAYREKTGYNASFYEVMVGGSPGPVR